MIPYRVAMVMGSDSDFEVMEEGVKALKEFGLACDVQVMSAHRSPAAVSEFATNAHKRGIQVIIAGAGGAAHLAGVVAAHTSLPVIGVPLSATPLAGFDALLATVQMPPGIPVATVAVGKFGARNAAILAVQIMALSDADLKIKLDQFKISLADQVAKKNDALQKKMKAEN
ncbi:MAG: 5-(carboxyamino)imidazole ribonucleotide mutase [Candidatus Omnitrophica bacterium]|nr:5-(carboxyamino)imidazole ribonucleotide mutase [Candidatus Omnitrophota bacterium]